MKVHTGLWSVAAPSAVDAHLSPYLVSNGWHYTVVNGISDSIGVSDIAPVFKLSTIGQGVPMPPVPSGNLAVASYYSTVGLQVYTYLLIAVIKLVWSLGRITGGFSLRSQVTYKSFAADAPTTLT